MILSIFSCAFWLSVCLCRNVCLGLLPIFYYDFCFWALWAASIFWRLIPCWLHHCKYFLPFSRLFSFAVQKFLSLIRSHLFIFVFISITLGCGSKSIYCSDLCQNVLPMFSCKSFIVSGLTFRPLIHFEFVFCITFCITECSNFILLHPVQFSQHHLLKKLSFLYGIFLPPLYSFLNVFF